MGSIYLALLAAVALFLVFLYLYITWTFDYWEKKGVPYVKPVPFFGTIKDQTLLRVPEYLMMQKMYKELEGHRFGGGFQFRRPFLLLRDPELIKTILIKDFSYFHDRGFLSDEETYPMSVNLITLNGSRWRALRSKLTSAFTSGKIKLMYALMQKCSEELERHMAEPAKHGQELEMRDVLAKYTTDVIGTCAFGLQFNSMTDSNSQFRVMTRQVFAASFSNIIRRLVYVFLPGIAKFFRIGYESSTVSNFFLNVVKETVDYREENNIERNDFLQLLIQIKNQRKVENDKEKPKREDIEEKDISKDDINMTDALLAAQVYVFLLAGFESSSTAMGFALYELALNPDIQTRVQNEVDDVTHKHGNKVTYEALQEMTYLDKVVAETLRKYPPGSNLIRACTKQYTIPGTNTVINEGVTVYVSVYSLHHDPKYYPEPERFDPERFDEENKARRHNCTYLPFGEGPRNCIGLRFGLTQTKAGLASLLKSYHFSPCKKTVVPIRHDPKSIITASLDGIWLKITRRHS